MGEKEKNQKALKQIKKAVSELPDDAASVKSCIRNIESELQIYEKA